MDTTTLDNAVERLLQQPQTEKTNKLETDEPKTESTPQEEEKTVEEM